METVGPLEIRNDLLFRIFITTDGASIYQLFTPSDRQYDVIRYHHDLPSSGHLGVEKTLEKVRQAFYLPGMTDSSNNSVEHVITAQPKNYQGNQTRLHWDNI